MTYKQIHHEKIKAAKRKQRRLDARWKGKKVKIRKSRS
jgi:hypothetical protein